MTIEDSLNNRQLTIPWTIDNFFDRMRGILGNMRIFHGWVSSFTFASTRKAFAAFTKKKMMFSWKHSHSEGHQDSFTDNKDMFVSVVYSVDGEKC